MDASEQMQKYRDWLSSGKLLAYPTETSWGLAADATNQEALKNLFALKPQLQKSGVSIMVRDLAMARGFAVITPQVARVLEVFWPGPSTFVLPTSNTALDALTAATKFIALRCSPHPFVKALLWEFPNPITAVHAGQHESGQAITMADLAWLPEAVHKVDWPDLATSRGSSVVRVDQNNRFRILREGDVSARFLKHTFALTFALEEGV